MFHKLCLLWWLALHTCRLHVTKLIQDNVKLIISPTNKKSPVKKGICRKQTDKKSDSVLHAWSFVFSHSHHVWIQRIFSEVAHMTPVADAARRWCHLICARCRFLRWKPNSQKIGREELWERKGSEHSEKLENTTMVRASYCGGVTSSKRWERHLGVKTVSPVENRRGPPKTNSRPHASIGRSKMVFRLHSMTVLDWYKTRTTNWKKHLIVPHQCSSIFMKVGLWSMVVQTEHGWTEEIKQVEIDFSSWSHMHYFT